MTKAMAPPLAGVERGASTRAPRRGHPALTLLAAVLGVMMVALDGTIVAVANPAIQSEPARLAGWHPVGHQRLPARAGGHADHDRQVR